MPRTLPAGAEAWMSNPQHPHFILLADVQTSDGTNFFFADFEGSYPSLLTGNTQFYSGWVKSGTPFVLTKDLSTNAGDFTLQNLSGNKINRDVSLALQQHEFEGALCMLRIWMPLFDASIDSFHGSLSEQEPQEDQAVFRHLQLFDTSTYDVCDDLISEICPWRYKSAQCGSTGTATTCDKLFSTCQATDHASQERFSGVLTIVPNIGMNQIGGFRTPFVGDPDAGAPRPLRYVLA